MKFIQTLKNIWGIEELRKRILFTLGLLLVYRLGCFVVMPGVLPEVLKQAAENRKGQTSIMGIISTFTGGAFDNASIFALGVMPYITASIIVQLLGFAVPYFNRLQNKEGESGRKKINQMQRLLTVAITLVQGGGYLTLLKSQGAVVGEEQMSSGLFWFCNLVILTAGTVFCMWLGEKITDRGLGNGTSLIIMAGIIARLPIGFSGQIEAAFGQGQLFSFIIMMFLWVFVVMGTILLVQAVRNIPLHYAKQTVGRAGAASYTPNAGGNRPLPIKVNSAGVMPVIFAQALMFLPITALQYFNGGNSEGFSRLSKMTDFTSVAYNVVFFILVVVFTYIYTALMINPNNQAEFLKRSNAYIPGVKPGQPTADFIDSVTSKITLPGAIFLGIISILPSIAATMGANSLWSQFFGGTTLLIMVGVILDTLRVVETYLVQKKMQGLIEDGRIQGRNTYMQQSV
jgi:preprotein translocase subunit SecY